ncbi:cell division control protein 6 [Natronolimnohabitans innermongolicus JCM 12255]|uniref:Cell division control protein 6 n=1 Tax=Natronolimnohabitans innermongolicus JCM 12255 TaxID=1227499 RepID=L9WHD1_9EURY|nr:cell division control protein 6 [Natronolimnohabitans innermongolicus JCM 12255]
MRDHLGELSMLGIATWVERNKGEAGGRYYEYSLDTSPDLLLEALEETVDRVGMTEAIQKRLTRDF